MLVFDIENLVSVLDVTLENKRKRHIAGGLLLSISLLFCGMAITVMTLSENKDHERKGDDNIEQ